MQIKTAYSGMTLTARYLTVHFKLEVGGTLVRASELKIKIDDLPGELLAEALDKHTRRILLEVWGRDDLLPGID